MGRPVGLFITGTDTGVGKTLIAAGLAAWCRAKGLDVGVMKPIATGGIRRQDQWISPDAMVLARAAGVDDPVSLINPVCFREPLAPYVAAQRAGQSIRWDSIRRASEQLQARHRFLMIEGIGGLLVPLTRRHTVADLIRAFNLPVVIVARRGLGTLNHTLLTVREAQRQKLRMRGVLLNAADPPTRDAGLRLAEQTNPHALEQCLSYNKGTQTDLRNCLCPPSSIPLLGQTPYEASLMSGSVSDSRWRHQLVRWVERHCSPVLLEWLLSLGMPGQGTAT
ncbi:MAG: dethiobiotin synthase [Candidatus Omnitrophica bacterium]|nr:dethiobiotin synthase [Candidatus Omnitrophota bacterium]